MTHEELSRLEKEAGWQMVGIPIAHFKALVAAAERERCAKVCEERADKYGEGDGYSPSKESACYECAYAIRKGE